MASAPAGTRREVSESVSRKFTVLVLLGLFRPRFSLRALFCVVTLSALGMAWWLAPYEVESEWNIEHLDFTIRQVATMRTSVGRTPIRDGLTSYFDERGAKIAEEMWVADGRDGRYKQWSLDGELECEGQFSDGERQGTWNVHKVQRSSLYLGCPPEQDQDWPNIDDLRLNRWPPGPAALGDEEHEYDQGHRIRSTASVVGPLGVTEVEVTEWANRDFLPTHRTRWARDRKAKLEDEAYKEYGLTKWLKGWYPSGAKQFEGTFTDGWATFDQNCHLRYWNERGELIHDLVIEDGQIKSEKGRPSEEIFRTRVIFCSVGGRPPLPIHDDLGDPVRVLVDKQPLDKILARISAVHEIPIVLDHEALELADIHPSAPITIDTRALPLHSALHLAIEPYGLTYVRLFNQLLITTWDRIPKGGERSRYDPCSPPKGWKNPTGMERYDDDRRVECFKQLQVHKDLKLESANLVAVAKAIGDACGVRITVDRDKFRASDLTRTVSLETRHEDAFDLLGSALFQLGARAVERDGGIVILPREPLKRRPRPPEPAGF